MARLVTYLSQVAHIARRECLILLRNPICWFCMVVFPLLLDGFDRLVLYSLLMSVVALLVLYLYKTVCNRRFLVSRYRFFWDSSLYKRLMSFSGWSL